uniref:Cyclin-L1-1 n=1 Tax=Chenopodium quinoa TaxID=63459 RepID=A0A803MST1_CHEQI
MACTIDFRCLDEGFGGKTAKRKRESQSLASETAQFDASMEVDNDNQIVNPPAKRAAISSTDDPNKPVFGRPTYDGVIAGRVSGRNWKQPRKHRSSAMAVSRKPVSLEQKKRDKDRKNMVKTPGMSRLTENFPTTVDSSGNTEEREAYNFYQGLSDLTVDRLRFQTLPSATLDMNFVGHWWKMIYTAIDTFYLTEEHLTNSPSRKDAIDEETEITLRVYGCDLIQESGILLRLPQAVMATAQVLFHRFYCKKSFARFNVKRVAASCVWLASKLEESPRKARQVLIVFHRMECRRENSPKYSELKMDLIRTERHLLKEMGFICHVEHPHKFISNYLAVFELKELSELRQDAWNLANDSLRTTLCVRFKSEVVACGVVYAAARRFGVPLPENPPWWKVFDADKSGIDEVCRVLAHLYSRPKAKYIPVRKESVSFTSSNKSWDSQNTAVPKEGSLNTPVASADTGVTKTASGAAASVDTGGSRDALVKQALDKLTR